MKRTWRLWHPRVDEDAEQARYEAARLKAEDLKRRAEQIDGWTKRAKRVMS